MRVYAPTWTLAAGVAFLLAFSEMELASLLYVNTFSVALFDAQVGGLVLRSSLARLAPGLILQVLVLGAVLQAATRVRPRFGGAFSGPRRQGGRGMALSIWGWHAVAVFVSALLPCVFLFLRAAASLREQALRRGLWEDVAVSAGCAAVTALALLFLARRLCETLSMDRGFRSWGWALMACLPGLCGGLVLALAGVAVFSSPGPVAVRDTPLPVVLVHVILSLPVALAAQAALGRSRRAVELHAARLARGLIPGAERARRAARLMRALASRGETWVFLLLFHLSYLELTAAAILSAPGLTPVSVRLYNLMHYGRMPALSAMLALSMLVPATALGFAFVRARVAERGGSCA
jgi:ABC-type Fe3+ transport system permease subunit